MLTFTRDAAGVHSAEGRSHTYLVTRARYGWRLDVFGVVGEALVSASLSHRWRRRAFATARAYEALGDDFNPASHEGRSRYEVAVNRAYL